jgi:predicted glycoside hydrolase/deacetylase ChbG (UPF0249 family)
MLVREAAAQEKTFAERLGWGPEDRVVIFHIDDAGMSHDSNRGSIRALEGLANSVSTMMPCPWVSEWNAYLKENPEVDNGVHLTLTSEWEHYRWGPVAGRDAVPGLVDEEGALWDSVAEVIENATPDEVEIEIRAQIARAQTMGMPITHLDSHMGTLFASPLFFQRYLKVGAELGIPILVPGGHLQYISSGAELPVNVVKQMAQTVWDAGLPVIDDIHTESYSWPRDKKAENFIQVIREMKPGITEIIIHATDPTEVFDKISTSGETRLGDMEAMLSEELAQAIEEEGIILTTWRELMERRKQVE